MAGLRYIYVRLTNSHSANAGNLMLGDNMLYHIYHPNPKFPFWWLVWFVWVFRVRTDEWLIKDADDQEVIYSTKYSKGGGHKDLYQGSYEDGLRIGTIKYINDDTFLITGPELLMLSEAQKSFRPPGGWFFHTPCFEWENSTMCWSGTECLTDAMGFNLATFTASSWKLDKFGEVEIPIWVSEDTRRTILSTMVAMDWHLRIEAKKAAAERAKVAAQVAQAVGTAAVEIAKCEIQRKEGELRLELEREREKQWQHERERDLDRERERQRAWEREMERERARQRERERERERERRERQRDREPPANDDDDATIINGPW
jgi:hypothetical protein